MFCSYNYLWWFKRTYWNFIQGQRKKMLIHFLYDEENGRALRIKNIARNFTVRTPAYRELQTDLPIDFPEISPRRAFQKRRRPLRTTNTARKPVLFPYAWDANRQFQTYSCRILYNEIAPRYFPFMTFDKRYDLLITCISYTGEHQLRYLWIRPRTVLK